MRTDCAVCGDMLVKDICVTKRNTPPEADEMMWKTVAVSDDTKHGDNQYTVEVWCHTCEIIYRTH